MGGTPKSSILIGFSIINQPFWGSPISGNHHSKSSPPVAADVMGRWSDAVSPVRDGEAVKISTSEP